MPIVEYGGVQIPVTSIQYKRYQQNPMPVGIGTTLRSARQGTKQFVIQSLDGGLGVHRASVLSGAVVDGNKRYQSSDGLWAHQAGELVLPPAVTSQATLQSVNASGYLAAGKNPVHAQSALGSATGAVQYVANGPYLFRMDQSTGALSLADTRTDNIVWIGEVYANSTLYFAIITDGTTDDCKVTTDPTAGTISWSTWITLASGDRFDFAVSFPYMGPNGVTYLQGKFGTDQGAFYLDQSDALNTNPSIVPDEATKSLSNPDNPTLNTGAIFPYQEIQKGTVFSWSNLSNLEADDGAYATFAPPAGTDAAFVAFFDLRSVLPGSSGWEPIGMAISYQRKATNNTTSDHATTEQLEVITSFIHEPISDADSVSVLSYNLISGNKWATSDEIVTYGDSNNLLGGSPSVNDWYSANIGVYISVGISRTTSFTASIDYITMTAYYRRTGIQSFVPIGCKFVGIDPYNLGRVWYIRPSDNDSTGRTKTRGLYYVDISWDSGQNRPTTTHTPKYIPCFEYIQAAALVLDSMFVAVGNDANKATTLLKFNLSSLTLTDINWSREQGFTDNWSIVNLYRFGSDVIMQCTNGTYLQDMIYITSADAVHFFSPKVNTGGKYLTWWGSGPVDVSSHYRITMYDVSTTYLAAFRQYTPDTPLLDPSYALTSIVKQDGPLAIILPDMDLLGPEEANMSLNTAICFGSNISATSTVALYYSIDGGATFTLWHTFTSSGEKSTLTTPVDFNRVTLKIVLDHTAGSTDTPNPFPIIIEGVAEWPALQQWTCAIDPTSEEFMAQFPDGVEDMWSQLDAVGLSATLNVGTTSVIAKWSEMQVAFEPSDQPIALGKALNAKGSQQYIVFEEVIS